MVKTRLLAPVLVAALALGLTACADPGFLLGGASGGTTGTSSPTPGTDAPGAEDDDAEAGAALDPAACLVGTWRADNDFFLSAMRQFGTQVTSVDGQVTVAFAADGSYTTGYADWTITAVEEGIEVTVRRDGVDEGEYSASDTHVSLRDVRIGSTLVMTGQGLDMAVDPAPASYADAPYTCDAGAAVITTHDGELQLRRV